MLRPFLGAPPTKRKCQKNTGPGLLHLSWQKPPSQPEGQPHCPLQGLVFLKEVSCKGFRSPRTGTKVGSSPGTQNPATPSPERRATTQSGDKDTGFRGQKFFRLQGPKILLCKHDGVRQEQLFLPGFIPNMNYFCFF